MVCVVRAMIVEAAIVLGSAAALAGVYYQLVTLSTIVLLITVLSSVTFFGRWLGGLVHFLDKSEQMFITGLTDITVVNGPCVKIVNPFTCMKINKKQAQMLNNLEYALVMDVMSGKQRVEVGPQLLFLGAYDSVVSVGHGQTLSQTEYVEVTNQITGEVSIRKGPCVWFPSVPEEISQPKRQAVALQEDEYVRMKNVMTGERWVQRGKTLLFLEPKCKQEGRVEKAWTLKSFEYVRLLDKVTGKVSVHRGEKTVFPGADEEALDSGKQSAIDLKVDEYVRLEDQSTGEVRVIRGVNKVFLGPNDRMVDGGKQKAVQIDDEHAVLVRDTASGQLRLTKDKQLFVPGPNDKIEEVRQMIKLEDHEAMIIKDKNGVMHIHYGNTKKSSENLPRSFFLQPYESVVRLWWSKGMRREERTLMIERFDLRPQYMWFEFDCRTSDNVELVLEVTMFWEVVELMTMIRCTGNLPGDIYNQARSLFIKRVAQVTLKQFMEQLHSIAGAIHTADPDFYVKRGVSILSLEVTRYKCAEARTSEVLQQIIEEATNRLNRLSQAESENEIKIFKMQGEIEQYKLNGDLLELKHAQAQEDARNVGAAEADCVSAFVQGLQEDVPKLEDRMMVWQVLRKTDALKTVSEGGGSFYYTPKDVDLSIRTS